MKAEHRKELETNVLADSVGRTLKGLKEGPSRGTWVALSMVGVVLILFFTWRIVKQHAETSSSDLYLKWAALATPAELEAFAKDNAGTMQGRLARFRLARLDMAEGIANVGTPQLRAEALDHMRKAGELYKELANETGSQSILQQEALLNAGKAFETLDELDTARGFYSRLQKSYPNTYAGKDAEDALKRLEGDSPDLVFLKQFVKQKEKEKAPGGGPDLP